MKKLVRLPFLSLLFLVMSCTDKKADKKEEEKPKGHTSHDHHHHTPHLGEMAEFYNGDKAAGTAELKLHDDKGDLELWLTKDKAGKVPFDLPLDTVITVTFPKLDNKTVELRVRNKDKNEDEDGKGNIRESATNYFIFPGDTGADASFLVGKEFKSEVILNFKVGDSTHSTKSFVLKPHVH